MEEDLDVRKNIDGHAFANHISNQFYAMLVDQIQEFTDICIDYGIDRNVMIKILKEYSDKTKVKGLKVKKVKGQTWYNNLNQDKEKNTEKENQTLFFKEITIKQIVERDEEGNNITIRYIDNITFNDGYSPILNDEGLVCGGVKYNKDGNIYRNLLKIDNEILSIYNISHI
jgi:hypothetical protein